VADPTYTASGGNISISQVAQDAAGDTFLIGSLNGTATLDGATISSTAGTGGSGFVAKIDANGNVAWTQVLGGATGNTAYADSGLSLAVSADGQNVYVGVQFIGTFNLPGGGTMVSPNTNYYGGLLDLSGSTGATAWHMEIGSNQGGSRSVSSIALDGNGNVYAAGGMYDENPQTASASPDNIVDGTGATISSLTSSTSYFGQGLYVLKASASTGSVDWATPVNGYGQMSGGTLGVDGSGHLYMAGELYGAQFGASGGNVASASNYAYGAFLASVDESTGTFGAPAILAPNTLNSNGNSFAASIYVNSVAVDSSGGAVIAGSFGDGAKLVPGSSTAQTGLRYTASSSGFYFYTESKAFVEKFDSSLNSQWLATETGTAGSTMASDSASSVAVTADGSVAVVGTLNGNQGGTSQFGGDAINSPGGNTKGFVWTLNGGAGATTGAGGYESAGNSSANTVTSLPNGDILVGLDASTSTNVNPLGASDYVSPGGSPGFLVTESQTPPCFCRGARILTERGEVAVESLAVGDRVVTARGEARPIVWIGERELEVARHAFPLEIQPVRVRAGAFGGGLPHRDLWLSPQHAVYLDGVLIPIISLANGASVAQIPVERVSYFHVELESHDVLLAEGLPAESFLDCGSREGFANAEGFVELHPTFAPKSWDDACAPLKENGPEVEAARRRLLAQAERLGFRRCDEPDLHIVADGEILRPKADEDGRFEFSLPRSARNIVLVSRSWRPADAVAQDDKRHLGVAVSEVAIDGRTQPLESLRAGWHPLESEGDRQWRWTDGRAALPAGTRTISVQVCGASSYWIEDESQLRRAAA
jgi:hypothetical protein